MFTKRAGCILLIIFTTVSAFLFQSCRSEKATCEVNRNKKTNYKKKNRNNYGKVYNYKAKPVRKDYVIRNGR